MLTGLAGSDRKPTYAVMVTDRGDPRGTALWSDPRKEYAVDAANAMNTREADKGRPPRFYVETRFPVSLGVVFSGDGSPYSKVLSMMQERRNNGC